MSSILTNTSAMVALQTLKGINSNLAKTQSDISTGKSIGSAKDNAAIWSISKVMESDVKGFSGISDSLALGESTVAVARQAAETVTDLLTQMKGKIVAAQEENVDRDKLQTDIVALRDQISSVVSAAQFNGLNLVDGTSSTDVSILSSLDRDSSGGVTAKHIDISRQNLSVTGAAASASFGTTAITSLDGGEAYLLGGTADTPRDDATTAFDPTAPEGTIAASGTYDITIGQVAEGISYRIVLDDVNVNVAGGGSTLGQRTFEYVASATDGTSDVAKNLQAQISSFFSAATDSGYAVSLTDNVLTITNGSSDAINVGLEVTEGGTPGTSTANAGLVGLQTLDVTTNAGATGALASIEDLIQTATDAAASFGSAETRIATQTDFVSSLTSAMKEGIGSLVDADMEEASARLQALQTQQQLGIQALSIANQQPQNILSLFK